MTLLPVIQSFQDVLPAEMSQFFLRSKSGYANAINRPDSEQVFLNVVVPYRCYVFVNLDTQSLRKFSQEDGFQTFEKLSIDSFKVL